MSPRIQTQSMSPRVPQIQTQPISPKVPQIQTQPIVPQMQTQPMNQRAQGTQQQQLQTRLLNMLQTLPQDRVLDVSNIMPHGHGIRVVIAPRGTRSTKVGVDRIPIISSNYASYALAVGALGTDYDFYVQEYARLYDQEDNQ